MDYFLVTISKATTVARFVPSTGATVSVSVSNPAIFETDGPITKDPESQVRILLNEGLNVISGIGQPSGFAQGDYASFLTADEDDLAIEIVQP